MKYLALAVGLVVVLAPKLSFCDAVEDDFKAIIDSIPQNWWDGGWDKLNELKDFISNHPDKPVLCAQAQYYIGCYYYSVANYDSAIRAYDTVISSYPTAVSERAKAQFEKAQIYLNCKDNPVAAINEYQKVLTYNDVNLSPMSQLMIGRAYMKQNNKAQAKTELQKVIDNYPRAGRQSVEAYVDLGDIALSEQNPKGAISYYKQAYLICPLGEPNTLQWVIDKIYLGLRTMDMSLVRANQFIKYQKYGPQGEDKISGTQDDLQDPLAEF